MTMRPGLRHGWAALTGAAFLTLVVSAALAAAPSPRTTRTKSKRAPAPVLAVAARPVPATPSMAVVPPGTLGLMAFLDPETGQLSGPIGQLVPPADQRAVNVILQEVPIPGGGWMLDLKGTLMEYYVLEIDGHGARRISCVRDPRHLLAQAPLPRPVVAEER